MDYLEIFELRLKFEDKAHGVNKTWMGCFTKDSAIALRLHKAGVPVWLIRDVRLVDDKINIRQVIPFTPADLVFGMYLHPIKNFAQPFDIRYKGPSDHQRQAAVRQPYLTFEEIPMDQTEVNRFAASREPSSGKAPTKTTKNKSAMNRPALRQNQSQVGRDKWCDMAHPFMPNINTFFASAMTHADKDLSRVKPTHARMDEGYRLPDPGLFVNVLSSQSLKKYLANWLACRESWLRHVYMPPPSPLPRSQSWRDLLITQPTTPQPSSSSGQMPSGKTGKSKAKLDLFFGDELSLLRQFWTGSQMLQWRGQKIEAATLENSAASSHSTDHIRDLRRSVAWSCSVEFFPQHALSMWDKDFSTRNDGLNAESFQDALPYFENFRQVLIAWDGAPQDLKQPFTESMPEGEKWQRMKQCALFYVQSFYDNTGRPPVVPHILYAGP
ncbi:hypothetical protein DFJ58DRAFT_734966 [Suillus subalutaceus]|uniref:uncharacterized protein n=1 Tax=Suillus subalutaceus TaxID=48586 RepID=UPI001B8846DF|nr:uncharacterized protein DFJ58DRAFT_734966 [Suillus subalutaceus]KAG1836437.1 hypothetical protein DFJ58DRAFT_734966 [Suillus subalutaceus]